LIDTHPTNHDIYITLYSPVTDASTTFEINGQWHSVKCQGEVMSLLQKGSDGYKILVVGKNGKASFLHFD